MALTSPAMAAPSRFGLAWTRAANFVAPFLFRASNMPSSFAVAVGRMERQTRERTWTGPQTFLEISMASVLEKGLLTGMD